ncbi:hypothetical protein Tco_0736009, partial [Tanacetum coccineum]
VDSLKELGKAVVREMLFMCFTKAIIWDLASWRNIHFMLQVMLVDSLKELGKGHIPILPNGEALGILVDTIKRCEVYVDQTKVGKRRKIVEDEGHKEKKKSEIMLVSKLERERQQKMNANNSVLEKVTDSRLPP